MAGRLADKVVLVTGAARGIGAASARRMASEGAILWLNDISDEIEAVAAELDAVASIGDASDAEYVNGWVDAAAAAHGRIDVLYNNVGVSRTSLIGEMSDDDWRFQQRMTLDTCLLRHACGVAAFRTPWLRRDREHVVRRRHRRAVRLGGYGAAKAGRHQPDGDGGARVRPDGYPGQRRHAGPDRDRSAARPTWKASPGEWPSTSKGSICSG